MAPKRWHWAVTVTSMLTFLFWCLPRRVLLEHRSLSAVVLRLKGLHQVPGCHHGLML